MNSTLTLLNEKVNVPKTPDKVPTPEELLKEFEDMSLEDKKGSGEQATEKDLDEMSNTQLAQFIMNNVNQNNNKVIERLEFIRVNGELRDLKKDHPDFDDFKDQVFKIAYKNPNNDLIQNIGTMGAIWEVLRARKKEVIEELNKTHTS